MTAGTRHVRVLTRRSDADETVSESLCSVSNLRLGLAGCVEIAEVRGAIRVGVAVQGRGAMWVWRCGTKGLSPSCLTQGLRRHCRRSLGRKRQVHRKRSLRRTTPGQRDQTASEDLGSVGCQRLLIVVPSACD
jgi:hypothetical protein